MAANRPNYNYYDYYVSNSLQTLLIPRTRIKMLSKKNLLVRCLLLYLTCSMVLADASFVSPEVTKNMTLTSSSSMSIGTPVSATLSSNSDPFAALPLTRPENCDSSSLVGPLKSNELKTSEVAAAATYYPTKAEDKGLKIQKLATKVSAVDSCPSLSPNVRPDAITFIAMNQLVGPGSEVQAKDKKGLSTYGAIAESFITFCKDRKFNTVVIIIGAATAIPALGAMYGYGVGRLIIPFLIYLILFHFTFLARGWDLMLLFGFIAFGLLIGTIFLLKNLNAKRKDRLPN